MEFEKRATCMTTFASNYLWRISPVSNEITVIPVLEEATMRSSSQQHVTLPISCPASGTVSNNEPSLMCQTLTTPSCDPVTKQNATINNWQQQNWLEIRDSRGAEHGSRDFRRTTSSVHFFLRGGGGSNLRRLSRGRRIERARHKLRPFTQADRVQHSCATSGKTHSEVFLWT